MRRRLACPTACSGVRRRRLTSVSAGTIGKDIKEFQLEHSVALPYRESIHDMGPTLTHKRIIIQQFVRNIPTPKIARRTYLSEEACDWYIKGFKKVQKLFNDGIPVENIASELEMSKALVREYVAIVEETTKDWMGKKEGYSGKAIRWVYGHLALFYNEQKLF